MLGNHPLLLFQTQKIDFPIAPSVVKVESQADGTALVTGNVYQTNAPDDWFMPLPIIFKFGGNGVAQGTVAAFGPKAPFSIKLPTKPESMDLDPQKWVLSEKTSNR